MSYMSKRLWLLLCLLTAIGLVLLAGCGKQTADQGAGGQSSPAGQQTRLAIGGSSMGGTAYMWTSGISKIINQYVEGVYSEVQETGGSSESLTLMASGQLQMTTANNDAAYKAYRGEGTAKIDVRTLLARYPGLLHVVVPKDSPVNSLYELKGKRVSVGEVGSSVNVGNKNILEALGLRFEDFRPEFLSVEESIEALRDGDIDAWLSGASFGVPIPSLTDLATS
ncbi:MAG: TAXI family TRAP transporter solute-binding subunit [Clostridia bacterium]|nr:TAXI family TRAP transporter solute-binding subunit [Clostridia bacterium]